MPRKTAKHRRPRSGMPFLRGDILIDITPVSTERTVLMTNGSGFRTVTVTGTVESAWNWAAEAGARGGIVPGERWYPVAQHAYHGPESEDVGSFSLIEGDFILEDW